MKEKIYYDTIAVTFFQLKQGEKTSDKFSPKKIKGEPVISLNVEEEYIHKMANGGYEAFGGKDFFTVWKHFSNFKSFFNVISPDRRKVRHEFNTILKILVSKYGDAFEKRYRDNKKNMADCMDILHLATADLGECEKFLTFDSDFLVFKEVRGRLNMKNLKRIIFLDQEDGSKKETILLY